MINQDKDIVEFGPIEIIDGYFKGRIGYYDDDFMDDEEIDHGIIFFGDHFITKNYYFILIEFIAKATTNTLLSRWKIILSKLENIKLKKKKRIDLLQELIIIERTLSNNYSKIRDQDIQRKSIFFISHSSEDKTFAKIVSSDLRLKGHTVWLDEWAIKVGESIPKKVGEGIQNCDYMIIILSKNAINSRWVENEWHTKYWDEIQTSKVSILPILLEKCDIPNLLKSRKYADFTLSYEDGFNSLFSALK